MLLAADRLENSSDPVSVIALSLGYESESAFSTAFKRVMGCSPRQFSRAPKPDSYSQSEDVSRANRVARGLARADDYGLPQRSELERLRRSRVAKDIACGRR
jgi:Helix-turn-helix domain